MLPCGLFHLVVLLGLVDLEFPNTKLKKRMRGQVKVFYSNTCTNIRETSEEQHHPFNPIRSGRKGLRT